MLYKNSFLTFCISFFFLHLCFGLLLLGSCRSILLFLSHSKVMLKNVKSIAIVIWLKQFLITFFQVAVIF